jgi:NAD+ kinase
MRALLFGSHIETIRSLSIAHGFTLVEQSPELVIAVGGDGTLMRSEHAWPGIPKLALRDSMICKKCSRLSNEEVLAYVAAGNYTTEPLMKLEAQAKERTLLAVNDIVLHNSDPRHGVRYRVAVNGRPLGGIIIGDGIVVATPFGSTAYYRSITDSSFELGIGLAFNNSTEQADHMVLKEHTEISVVLERGPATLYADNAPDNISLEAGDEVVIRRSAQAGTILVVE